MFLCRTPRHRRRGTILVLFALLVFALLTMAGLVIDLGLVRVTQQQMQSLAETEALEGLRYGSSGSQAIASLGLNANPEIRYKVGPDLNFTPGVGDANALQIMAPGQPFSFIPQANTGNQINGDLVQGTYALTNLTGAIDASATTLTVASALGFNNPSFNIQIDQEWLQVSGGSGTTTWTVQRGADGTTAAAHSQGATVLLVDPASEDSSYNRNDFINSGQSAFLARLRRTRNLQGGDRNSLDNQTGVSSSRNAVPLLFGRGALFADVPAASSTYSPRRDGITVRATAIASSVRAKTAGPVYPEYNLPGVTPYGLTVLAWELGVTTLAASVQPGDTTLTVLDGSSFPPGPFRVLINAEILLVTALDSTKTIWTVQRGSQNTTPAAHQAGTLVQMSGFAYNVNSLGQITLTIQQTTLAAPALPGDPTITVNDVSSFPTNFPFAAIIEPGTANGEIVLVNAVDTTKNTLQVQRGVFGTTAAQHTPPAPIQLYFGTTIAGQNAVQAGDTILTVAKGSSFPTTFPFMVIVDLGRSMEEILLVTNVNTTNPSSDQLTVQRGVLGTTAFQHQPGAPVQLYAGQMLRITSLSAAVGANDTSITVSSSSGFPAAPPFTVRIDTNPTTTELLTVTAVNGGTWTVQRGVQGTNPGPHSIGPVFLNAALTLGRRVDNLSTFPQPSDISSPQPTTLTTTTLSSFSLMPVFDNISQGSNAAQGMLTGFGQVMGQQVLVWNPTGSTTNSTANLGQFTLQKQPGALVPQNASATYTVPPNFFLDPQSGQPLSSTVLNPMLTALFQSHNSLPNSILAPALVR